MDLQPAISDAATLPSWRGLRVAIVHDWFQGFHGSEVVVETMLSDVFADAEEVNVFTFFAARELLPPHLAEAIVGESRLAHLPGIRQVGHERGRWRYLLPYMPYFFRGLALDEYDVVVASSHSCAIHARAPVGATHVCYCYTPMRYVWLPDVERDRFGASKRHAFSLVRNRLRRLDLAAAQRPGAYIAISTAVQERIKRFYGRDARVIHPPVTLADLAPGAKDPDHFLWVHRLVPYKRPELVAEAFRGLPQRLTMVGVGPVEDELRASLPENVTLHGWLPREQLANLYASAGGFIHVGEEDFGISMVEALAAGTPVIALGRGGATDIVRDGEDGVLLDSLSIASLREAITTVARRSWDPVSMKTHAERFARARFVTEFGGYLADLHAGE